MTNYGRGRSNSGKTHLDNESERATPSGLAICGCGSRQVVHFENREVVDCQRCRKIMESANFRLMKKPRQHREEVSND